MKLSVTLAESASPMAPFILRGSYESQIEKAAAIGYEAVELHVRDPELVDAGAIEQSCARHNVRVSSIGTGLGYGMDGLSLSSADPSIRQRAIERIEAQIRFAKRLGGLVIIGLIKGLVKETSGITEYERSVTDSLKRCLEAAERENVTLVLETINRFESDYLNTIEGTADFIRPFGSKQLKLHIDTFHMNIEERDAVLPIVAAQDVLGHVHFADNNRMYPGHGCFDFKKVLHALQKVRYNGYIAMECLSLPTPDEAAAEAYRNTSDWLRQLELEGAHTQRGLAH